MLALLGLVTVLVLLALIMSRLASPLAALVAVPTWFRSEDALVAVTAVRSTVSQRIGSALLPVR